MRKSDNHYLPNKTEKQEFNFFIFKFTSHIFNETRCNVIQYRSFITLVAYHYVLKKETKNQKN